MLTCAFASPLAVPACPHLVAQSCLSPHPRTPPPLSPRSRHRRAPPRLSAGTPPPPSDKPDNADDDHDIPQSAVDWNDEWSKFQEAGMRSIAPKGREPVSKQQVAAARAKGTVRAFTNKLPSRRQLFADWRFWLAIIVALSLFSAFVQSNQPVPGSPI